MRKMHSRAETTRSIVVDAAGAVFAENGYAGASIADITAATKATRGALYFHFTTKADLADAVLSAWIGSNRDAEFDTAFTEDTADQFLSPVADYGGAAGRSELRRAEIVFTPPAESVPQATTTARSWRSTTGRCCRCVCSLPATTTVSLTPSTSPRRHEVVESSTRSTPAGRRTRSSVGRGSYASSRGWANGSSGPWRWRSSSAGVHAGGPVDSRSGSPATDSP